MKSIEKNTISLSNNIINFTPVGIMERRILYVALSLINPMNEGFYSDYLNRSALKDFDFKYSTIVFSIDEFMSFWGLASKNGRLEVEKKAELLTSIKCNIRHFHDFNEGGGAIEGSKPIQVFECVEESDYGFIKLKFNHQFLPYLYNVDQHVKGYTTIPLSYLVKLKSEASFCFMRLCLNEVSLQKRSELVFNRRVDTLSGLLGVDSDLIFRDFNAKYLKVALKEINMTQLISVNVSVIKKRCKKTNRPKVYKLEFSLKAADFHERKSSNQDAKDLYEKPGKSALNVKYSKGYDSDPFCFEGEGCPF